MDMIEYPQLAEPGPATLRLVVVVMVWWCRYLCRTLGIRRQTWCVRRCFYIDSLEYQPKRLIIISELEPT